MQDHDGHRIPQAEEHPLLGGNRVTSAFRGSFDPQAGPKKLWPIAVGLVTAVSVVVIAVFLILP